MSLPTVLPMILRPETQDNRELENVWHKHMVTLYYKREFTKYDDRLVALAGIAQAY